MSSEARPILLDGFSPEDWTRLSKEELRGFLLVDDPVVFQVGDAEILGSFHLSDGTFLVELRHIDGGGEGVLPTIAMLANRYAALEGCNQVEWIVHAVSCAEPNLKLRRVLERRGFTIEDRPESGPVYHACFPVVGGSRPC